MSNYQRIFPHILIILSFFLVWVEIIESKFYGVGGFLAFGYYDSTLAVYLLVIIPISLLILILYFKSFMAYGFTMLFFAVMILIFAAQLPILIETHFYGPPDLNEDDLLSIINTPPYTLGLEDCIKNLAYSSIGFSLMNTKTLLEIYSWDIKKSRVVFFTAVLLYLLVWIFSRFA